MTKHGYYNGNNLNILACNKKKKCILQCKVMFELFKLNNNNNNSDRYT